MVAVTKTPIKVLLFLPGCGPCFVHTFDDLAALHGVLGCEAADATCFRVGGRLYALWCDDEGMAKGLPENRRLAGDHPYSGWMMRGPFFVTRVRDERDTSVDESDLPYVRQFVEF